MKGGQRKSHTMFNLTRAATFPVLRARVLHTLEADHAIAGCLDAVLHDLEQVANPHLGNLVLDQPLR
jgi:hypothetical protein